MAKNSFEDLVDEATRQIHSRLLEGGGKSMRSAVHMWMVAAINWEKENKKNVRKSNKNTPHFPSHSRLR
jgi:hypothetical protein